MISEVQKAMEESETPMFLYMIALALDKATNGKPIANQVVEIQKRGLRVLLLFVLKLINLGLFCLRNCLYAKKISNYLDDAKHAASKSPRPK
jgi:hypothetical protein